MSALLCLADSPAIIAAAEAGIVVPVLSVVIPAFNSESTIAQCLASLLESLTPHTEVIVVDDASTDGTAAIVSRFPCKLISLRENAGPAHARNAGALHAKGDLLFFLDADIVIAPDTLSLILRSFDDDPGLAALFGSYGPDTPDPGVYSQYKNLIHHYTHQTSREQAVTFCSGFGAIRRDVFQAIKGFDGRQRALEDIEFGYRLHRSGYRIRLVKELQLTHLKRYTFGSLVHSDLWNRAAAWTELMLRYRICRSDLNTKPHHVASVAISVLLLASIGGALFSVAALQDSIVLAVALVWLNRGFLFFVSRIRSVPVTVAVGVIAWIIYVLSSFGAIAGVTRWVRASIGSRA